MREDTLQVVDLILGDAPVEEVFEAILESAARQADGFYIGIRFGDALILRAPTPDAVRLRMREALETQLPSACVRTHVAGQLGESLATVVSCSPTEPPVPGADAALATALRLVRLTVQTRRWATEEAAARQRLHQTLEEVSDAVIALADDWTVEFFNRASERLLGVSRDAVVGRVLWDVFPLAKGSVYEREYTRVLRTREAAHFEAYHPESAHWFAVDAYPTATGMVAYFRDVTQRRMDADRLAEQGTFLEMATDAILVRELDDTITYWNRSAERIYGFTAEEAIGQCARDLINTRSLEFDMAKAAVLREGEWSGQLRQVRKDGRRVITECRWTLLRTTDGAPRGVLAINTDVTERRQLETLFLRAQRLESIGTLAGGIAHDLNNILAPISLSLSLLREQVAPSALPVIDSLQGAVRRGAGLIRQVLVFARGSDGNRAPLDLRTPVEEVARLARESFPKNIRVDLEVPAEPVAVEGDVTQLHQVLMNLCVNARDAMATGGALRISVRDALLDEAEAAQQAVPPGAYAVITIQDTGTGMPPDVLERIFDPFFSTKDAARGTGLGLSTTLGIVRSHGGELRVSTEVGEGTTFTIYLPRVAGSVEAPSVSAPTPTLPRGLGELVLFVDDEPSLRLVAERSLTHYGYRVHAAADGVDAVEFARTHLDEIAVVVCDLSMPRMDGPETIAALRALRPGLPIIVASGHSDHENTGKLLETGVSEFISKPFTVESLLLVLHGVLRTA